MGKQGDVFEKEHDKLVQLEKRKLSEENRNESYTMTQNSLFGKESDVLDDPNRYVRRQLIETVTQLKQFSAGFIIRRTRDSFRYDGQPINGQLPPYKTVTLPCILSQQEMENLKNTFADLVKSYVIIIN